MSGQNGQAPRRLWCRLSLSLSHVSNVTLISVYVVNGYVSRRSAVTDKSDIISAIVVALKPMCFVGIVGVDMPDNR